jgi:voltage-gated potassium channel
MERSQRSRLLRTRAAVLLTTLVAVLSLVTGIVNVGAPGFTGSLPGGFPGLIPEAVAATAGFTGTLTGFLMLVSTWALRRGLRNGWYATLVLLPLTALQGLLQSSTVSLPLVVLSVVSIPVVALNRGAFTRTTDLSTAQLSAGGALVGSLVYGTAGAFFLREEFSNVEGLIDALYFAVVTASTVGYGDVTPQTETATLFALSYLVLGTASFAIALGTLLGPAIEARFQRALGAMSESELTLLDDHLVVVGYGDLTEPIIDELAEDDRQFVVVTRDREKATRLSERGIQVLVGDPSDEEPLERAGVARARALVAATDDDAQDALAILTARELNPELRIVAAATDRENTKKLRRAGADAVISPAVIGGHMLIQSALGEEGVENTADRLLEDRERDRP